MIHSLLENPVQLAPGKFGVPEPTTIKEISVDDVDLVIAPIVAFDGNGVRLGYGKGYYDRLFNSLPTTKERIGVAFSIQEMDKIPKMPHDELMFSVFTEQSHFFFNNEIQL